MDPARIAGPGAAVGDTLVWDGARFVPAPGGDSAHVGTGSLSMAVGTSSAASSDRTTGAGHLATATASYASAFGYNAEATAADSTAIGSVTEAAATESTAVGGGSYVSSAGTSGSALGYDSQVTGASGVALGKGTRASAARAIAIGTAAVSNVADRALVKANDLELIRSAAGMGTSIILEDTVTGTRYRLSIASGALVIAAA